MTGGAGMDQFSFYDHYEVRENAEDGWRGILTTDVVITDFTHGDDILDVSLFTYAEGPIPGFRDPNDDGLLDAGDEGVIIRDGAMVIDLAVVFDIPDWQFQHPTITLQGVVDLEIVGGLSTFG